MAKKTVKTPVAEKIAVKRNSSSNKTLSIVALVINLFIPGLGTIIGKNTKTGITQLIITLVSYPLMMVGIGFITYAVAWVWALITSINMIKSS